MKVGLIALITGLVFCAIPKAVWGQEPSLPTLAPSKVVVAIWVPEPVLTESQKNELENFFQNDQRWHKFVDKNWNEVQMNWMGLVGRDSLGKLRDRIQAPAPPIWLVDYCQGAMESDPRSPWSCARLNASIQYNRQLQEFKVKPVLPQVQKDAPVRTSFLQRIHVDAGYTAAQFPSPHIYGLIGMHIGLVPLGPCEINVLPGTLLLIVPERNPREKKLQPSVTLGGGSCRLKTFKFLGTRKRGVLHINLQQVHILGQSSEEAMLGGSNLALVGFSITMK